MSAITLYGANGSGSAAVEAALQLLGLTFDRVEGATWVPGPGFEALRKVNPLAQVPTLVLDDGTVLSESAAILIALGLRYPHSGLLPAAPAARDLSLRGLVYIAANCYAMIGVLDYPERICPDCAADPALAKRISAGARERLHLLWDGFADAFMPLAEPSQWLAGPSMGALDLLAAVVSRWSGARAHLGSTRPAFLAHLLRVDREPRVADVFSRHWPPAK